MLETDKHYPKSSQPSIQYLKNLYSFLTSHYDSIIAVHISGALTGIYRNTLKVTDPYTDKNIHVVNSKQLSAALGLAVLRVAEAIDQGQSFEQIQAQTDKWVRKTHIYTDVQTLKYMVRGGRVSPLKGFMAKVMNLKPIVSVDEQGKAIAYGKSFSRHSNMKKIINIVQQAAQENKFWKYALVHSQNPERAHEYARRLTHILGYEPAYTVDISPVVGVHNGLGTVAVAFMYA